MRRRGRTGSPLPPSGPAPRRSSPRNRRRRDHRRLPSAKSPSSPACRSSASTTTSGAGSSLLPGGRRPDRLYGAEEVARLEFVKRAKLLGLTLEEIRELVSLAADCNEGELVPRLEEVLTEKLRETDRKIAELSAFRNNLLYYRRR